VGASVLVVEDERDIAFPLVRTLEREGYDVAWVGNGREVLDVVAAGPVDVVILDLSLPDMDGLDVCRALRDSSYEGAILIVTARTGELDRVVGLDSGADDYLTKPFDFAELIARVRALLRRQLPGASMAISIGDLRLDPVARLVHRGSRKIDLTQKEFALLEYFMRNADQILTRAMIGEQVWDFTWDRMTNVIDVYVNHLRRKLEDAGEARVIHAVRGVGYVLRSSEHGDDQDA
jgi:DNA-binding response OmpR family regulator